MGAFFCASKIITNFVACTNIVAYHCPMNTNNTTMKNFLNDYLEINDAVYIKGVQHKRLYMIIGIGKIDGEVHYRLKDCINGNKEIYHNEVVYSNKDYK